MNNLEIIHMTRETCNFGRWVYKEFVMGKIVKRQKGIPDPSLSTPRGYFLVDTQFM